MSGWPDHSFSYHKEYIYTYVYVYKVQIDCSVCHL